MYSPRALRTTSLLVARTTCLLWALAMMACYPCLGAPTANRQAAQANGLALANRSCQEEGWVRLNDSTDPVIRSEMAVLTGIMRSLAALTRYPTAEDWKLYYFKGEIQALSCGGGVVMFSQEMYRQHSNNRAILSFILAHEMAHDLEPLVVLTSSRASSWVQKVFEDRDKTVRLKRRERYADTGGVMLLAAAGMDRAAGVTWLKAQTGTAMRVLGFLMSGPAFDEHGRLTATQSEYWGFDHGTYGERAEWMQDAVAAAWRTSARPQPYFVGLNENLTYDQAMISRYEAVGGAANVGYPLDRNSSIFVHGWGGLLIQDYLRTDGETGAIVRKDGSSSAWWVHGAIWATFASSGGPASFGAPLEEEQNHPDGSGDRFQHFEKATFLWHKATGVTEVLPAGWRPEQRSAPSTPATTVAPTQITPTPEAWRTIRWGASTDNVVGNLMEQIVYPAPEGRATTLFVVILDRAGNIWRGGSVRLHRGNGESRDWTPNKANGLCRITDRSLSPGGVSPGETLRVEAGGTSVTVTMPPAGQALWLPIVAGDLESQPTQTASGQTAAGEVYAAFFEPLSHDNGLYNVGEHFGYVGGSFRILGNRWTYSRGHRFRDGLAQIETEYLAGDDASAYGLCFRFACRDGSEMHTGYHAAIDNSGRWLLAREDPGRWVELTSGVSGAVRTGTGARNTVGVICAGPRIQLVVNGVLLSEVHDSTYADGHVGPRSGRSGSVVGFRNLRVDPDYPLMGQTVAAVLPDISGTWVGQGSRSDGSYPCKVTTTFVQSTDAGLRATFRLEGRGWNASADGTGRLMPDGSILMSCYGLDATGAPVRLGQGGETRLQPDGTITHRSPGNPRALEYTLRRSVAGPPALQEGWSIQYWADTAEPAQAMAAFSAYQHRFHGISVRDDMHPEWMNYRVESWAGFDEDWCGQVIICYNGIWRNVSMCLAPPSWPSGEMSVTPHVLPNGKSWTQVEAARYTGGGRGHWPLRVSLYYTWQQGTLQIKHPLAVCVLDYVAR